MTIVTKMTSNIMWKLCDMYIQFVPLDGLLSSVKQTV
jgi:hypothetical protein